MGNAAIGVGCINQKPTYFNPTTLGTSKAGTTYGTPVVSKQDQRYAFGVANFKTRLIGELYVLRKHGYRFNSRRQN